MNLREKCFHGNGYLEFKLWIRGFSPSFFRFLYRAGSKWQLYNLKITSKTIANNEIFHWNWHVIPSIKCCLSKTYANKDERMNVLNKQSALKKKTCIHYVTRTFSSHTGADVLLLLLMAFHHTSIHHPIHPSTHPHSTVLRSSSHGSYTRKGIMLFVWKCIYFRNFSPTQIVFIAHSLDEERKKEKYELFTASTLQSQMVSRKYVAPIFGWNTQEFHHKQKYFGLKYNVNAEY